MNQVSLVGRLVREPYKAATPSGINYVRFTIAVNRPGQRDAAQSADFIPIVAWSNGNYIGNYCSKGMQISISGSFQSSTFTNKDGQITTTYEVLANQVEILESRQNQNSRQNNSENFNADNNLSLAPNQPQMSKSKETSFYGDKADDDSDSDFES